MVSPYGPVGAGAIGYGSGIVGGTTRARALSLSTLLTLYRISRTVTEVFAVPNATLKWSERGVPSHHRMMFWIVPP